VVAESLGSHAGGPLNKDFTTKWLERYLRTVSHWRVGWGFLVVQS
jgi:hypothetical protein